VKTFEESISKDAGVDREVMLETIEARYGNSLFTPVIRGTHGKKRKKNRKGKMN
jgi:hypothetical protein